MQVADSAERESRLQRLNKLLFHPDYALVDKLKDKFKKFGCSLLMLAQNVSRRQS